MMMHIVIGVWDDRIALKELTRFVHVLKRMKHGLYRFGSLCLCADPTVIVWMMRTTMCNQTWQKKSWLRPGSGATQNAVAATFLATQSLK